MQYKILILGLGSIGQRHFKNLYFTLQQKSICLFDINQKIINIYKNKYKIKTFPKYIDCLKDNFDIVLICAPPNLHIPNALDWAKKKTHLFIEKPISHNLISVNKLINICDANKLINMVGCNMRFHPCIKFIKKYLYTKKLGKIYSMNLEFGYYLPYWRPKQDYKKNYAAKKETGGGIILDDIHEFDLLFWLNDFSKIKKKHFIKNHVSNLKIETEDICIANFEFENKVIGEVKCDYLQQKYTRNCKIIAEKGNLYWDFNENCVFLEKRWGRKKLFYIKKFDLNSMFVEEIKYFLNQIKRKKQTFNNIKIASQTLKAIKNK